jgi:hypothetical protein
MPLATNCYLQQSKRGLTTCAPHNTTPASWHLPQKLQAHVHTAMQQTLDRRKLHAYTTHSSSAASTAGQGCQNTVARWCIPSHPCSSSSRALLLQANACDSWHNAALPCTALFAISQALAAVGTVLRSLAATKSHMEALHMQFAAPYTPQLSANPSATRAS